MPTLRVRTHIGQRRAVDRAVPDDIVGAPPGRRVIIAARHRVTDDLLALGQTEGIKPDHFGPQFRRQVGFVDRGAPSHIARVVRLDVGQKLPAHRRADAVGADQQVAAFAGPVGKHRGDAVGVLLDANKPLAEPVIRSRQCIEQCAVQSRPAAQDARRRALDDDVAVMVEAYRPRRRNAHGFVEIHAGAPEDADELRVRPEPNAAARQFLLVALEHHGIPAGRTQQMRHDQPAERPADDESTAIAHAYPHAKRMSSSAQADDPVITALRSHTPAIAITGCPAFAGHDDGGIRA